MADMIFKTPPIYHFVIPSPGDEAAQTIHRKDLPNDARVYFVTDKNEILCKRTPRIPRKIKKRLKKTGAYIGRVFIGIDYGLLDRIKP